MDDARLQGIPLEILQLVNQAGSRPLTTEEARILSRYAITNMASLDPEMADYIQSLLSTTPPANDPTALTAPNLGTLPDPSDVFSGRYAPDNTQAPPSLRTPAPPSPNAPPSRPMPAPPRGTGSPFDAVGDLFGGAGTTIDSMPDPVGAVIGNPMDDTVVSPGGVGNLAGSAAGKLADWMRQRGLGGGAAAAPAGPLAPPSPRAQGLASPRGDPSRGLGSAAPTGAPIIGSVNPDSPYATADPTSLYSTTNPDQGGSRDRRRERGPDWSQEIAALTGEALPGDSAYAGISPELIADVANNPDVAALMYSQKRGGGQTYAASLTPYMQGALQLAGLGAFGENTPGRDLREDSPDFQAQLKQVEDWIDYMGEVGGHPDPQAIYRQLFERIANTDVGTMDIGQGHTAGDLASQIEVTNGALMAGQAFMTPEQQEGLTVRLNRAAQRFLLAKAKGDDPEVPIDMTYPEYLRSVEEAQRWLGGN